MIPDLNPLTTTATSSSSSSLRRPLTPPPLPPPTAASEVEEDSDDDPFTVPDLEHNSAPGGGGGRSTGSFARGAASTTATASGASTASVSGASASDVQQNASAGSSGRLRKGRNPADRESRRLKRLLRNRVSAQQARERKKLYVNDLESRTKELEDKNANLEEKISILMNENIMLRKVLMNTRAKVDDEAVDQQKDLSGTS